MDSPSPRIVYMGTPEFALAPLKALIEDGLEIAAVITAPDKPAGRGRSMKESAVKTFARENLDCPILQPENLKDAGFLEDLKSVGANLFIVVAFRMLPEVVWSLPAYGTFNLHASLLPQYRGAAPINHAIINGETETGVSTFLIDAKIDTGRILLQEKIGIERNDNAGSLHDKLMTAGADLVVRTVNSVMKGELDAISQDSFNIPEHQLKKAPKIFKEDCRINWSNNTESIYNMIRGLSPFPAAFSELTKDGVQSVSCKLFSVSIKDEVIGSPGSIHSDGKEYINVATADACISIDSLQMAGKKRMNVRDFLRGFQPDIETYRFT